MHDAREVKPCQHAVVALAEAACMFYCTRLLAVFLVATTGVVVAADPVFESPAPTPSFLARPTLTDDWLGYGPAMRDADFYLRLKWTQIYQGLTKGAGDNSWEYGGKWDAQARIDLSKFGLWNELFVTAQGNLNYGKSVNGAAGTGVRVNAALFVPGIEGSAAADIMALYLTQSVGDLVTFNVGKLNTLESARGIPLMGGGGVDAF
jgi:porin